MSLPRLDIRAKLDPDVHAKLKVLCRVHDLEMHDLIESILVPAIENRCHEAMLVMQELSRQGISGNRRKQAGGAGTGGEPSRAWPATQAGGL